MATVGNTLADERRRQGKTVADVEAATHIRGRLIEALEDGEWEHLPASAYVKGYIQSYANFLGIPAEPLLASYRAETRLIEPRPGAKLPEPILPPREETHTIPARAGAIVAAGIVAVLLIGWGIVRTVGGDDTPPMPAVPEGSPAAGATSTPTPSAAESAPLGGAPGVTETADTEDGTSVKETQPETKPFELGVAVVPEGTSWLLVKVDGLKAYEGTLVGGQSKSWTVLENAEVTIGRPSAVTVTRDGEAVTPPTGSDVPTLKLAAEPR